MQIDDFPIVNNFVDEYEQRETLDLDSYEEEEPEQFQPFMNKLLLMCRTADERNVLRLSRNAILENWIEYIG